jgi:hypothetical protein
MAERGKLTRDSTIEIRNPFTRTHPVSAALKSEPGEPGEAR